MKVDNMMPQQAQEQGLAIMQTTRRDPRLTVASTAVIKGIHSLVFLGMAAAIMYTLYSGLTNRISRLTAGSIAVVIGEGVVWLMNNGRCPLTDIHMP